MRNGGVGASLLQEVWPEKLRTRAAGVLQAAFSCGFVIASVLWLIIGGAFGGSWRWLYIVGIAPAIFVVITGRAIPESEPWTRATSNASSAVTLRAYLHTLIIAVIISSSITVAFWAISSWVPTYVAVLVHNPREAVSYAGWAGLLFAIGEIFGCVSFGWLAESWGPALDSGFPSLPGQSSSRPSCFCS